MAIASTLKPAGCSMNRCLASIIDSFLCFIPFYCLWKDSIRGGKSFGKGAMGLRVMKMDGNEIGCMDSCIRNLCLTFPQGLGCCCVLFNDEKRHMGDLIAGTVVVEDE